MMMNSPIEEAMCTLGADGAIFLKDGKWAYFKHSDFHEEIIMTHEDEYAGFFHEASMQADEHDLPMVIDKQGKPTYSFYDPDGDINNWIVDQLSKKDK
jgi:hypothetical protein